METVGSRMRKLREEKGLTIDQVCERTGVSKGFLSDAENGNRNMSSQNLLKIANELNASLDYLLRGADVAAQDMHKDIHTFTSGATSSHKTDRFDFLPRIFLERSAKRWELGLKSHGEFNYRKGFTDKQFIVDRINHIQMHFMMFLAPQNEAEFNDDNLAAMAWGIAFLMELQKSTAGRKLLIEIMAERSNALILDVISGKPIWGE